MTRRARLHDTAPPRLISEAECAHHLGLSAGEFCRRAAELEAMGLPRRHPVLRKRDLRAIDIWLDCVFGLQSPVEARRAAVLERIGGMGHGTGAD